MAGLRIKQEQQVEQRSLLDEPHHRPKNDQQCTGNHNGPPQVYPPTTATAAADVPVRLQLLEHTPRQAPTQNNNGEQNQIEVNEVDILLTQINRLLLTK